LLTVTIDLTIAQDGSVRAARVVEPSGNPQLDQNALDSAMHTIYAPAAKDCKPAIDHYTFKVTFDPDL
jgi:TonB family protein